MRMDKGKIALTLLCVLLAASMYVAYYFWRMPSSETHYVATCRYRQEVEFIPMVTLKPSILYENRTILQPGEIAYLSLVDQVSISFSYRFTCDRPMSTFLLRYSVEGILEAEGGWRKAFTLTPEGTSNQTELTETYTLDIAEINQLIQTIEKETGTYAPKYTYKIAPRIQVEASTDQGPISEKHEPTMTITVTGGKERGRLDFGGLNHTTEGSLGRYETKEAVWSLYGLSSTVRNMQYASCVVIACLSTCLGYVAWWMMKRLPPSLIDSIRRRYGERIVESTEPTKRIEKVTIKVKSIEDLAKISDETIKPIIHEETILEKEGLKVRHHLFYLLDADVRYEFTAEEIAETTEPKKNIAKNKVKISRRTLSLRLLRIGAVVAFIWHFYWAFIYEIFVWNKPIWESIKSTQILINYICSAVSVLLIILSTVPIRRLTLKPKPKLQKEQLEMEEKSP